MVFLAAAVTFLLGLIIVIHWPLASVYVLGTLLGVDLLFHGAGWVSPSAWGCARIADAVRRRLAWELFMTKWVYSFGAEKTEGQRGDEESARRQGRQPRRDGALGLPVPPGFTITTEVCTYFYANGQTYPADLDAQVDGGARRRSGG